MEKSLSEQLRYWLQKHEDFLASPTLSSIRETIDVVEYYESLEERQARREPYIDRIADA